jgi:hypothetical protein
MQLQCVQRCLLHAAPTICHTAAETVVPLVRSGKLQLLPTAFDLILNVIPAVHDR